MMMFLIFTVSMNHNRHNTQREKAEEKPSDSLDFLLISFAVRDTFSNTLMSWRD